ncbi:TetR/AcrR family transcriptional regulator [Streptomyces sp. NPDC059153]|uniref:TetR/AcrR family transcriptional regulator n=1 Tax=unclassified Streptomyces TaxID=2593676 RepID=UPI0036CA84C6
MPGQNLRTRKMQRTREDVARTAARLFLAQGYERTTVDQIADAAEVSQRTVFRYFPAKEDLALAPLAASGDALVRALRSRPEEESPMNAMRAAFGTVLSTLQEGGASGVDAPLLRLIDRTPSLSAELLRRAAGLETRLAEVIAEREGIHTGSDVRPQLMVAVFAAAGSVAMRDWCGKENTTLSHIGTLLESALDHMGPGLFGEWRSGSGGDTVTSRLDGDG